MLIQIDTELLKMHQTKEEIADALCAEIKVFLVEGNSLEELLQKECVNITVEAAEMPADDGN